MMAWQALLRARGFPHSPGFCATKFSVHTLHPEICAKVKRKSIELSAFLDVAHMSSVLLFIPFAMSCVFYLFHILSRVMSVLITVARLHSVFFHLVGGIARYHMGRLVGGDKVTRRTKDRRSTAFDFSYSNLNLTSVADFHRVSWSFRVG